MNLSLLLPIPFGIISGGLSVFLLCILAKKYFKIDEKELESDLNSLIDKHLDDLVRTFGKQIPMSSMFLTGSLAQKLKLQAKEEILKMTPHLKAKLSERLFQKIKKNRYLLKVTLLGCGIGFLLGFIQSLIVFFVG